MAVTLSPPSVQLAGGKKLMLMAATAFPRGSCFVPCVHRSCMLGYTILSVGAMKVMEREIRARGLITTCRIWDATHVRQEFFKHHYYII